MFFQKKTHLDEAVVNLISSLQSQIADLTRSQTRHCPSCEFLNAQVKEWRSEADRWRSLAEAERLEYKASINALLLSRRQKALPVAEPEAIASLSTARQNADMFPADMFKDIGGGAPLVGGD